MKGEHNLYQNLIIQIPIINQLFSDNLIYEGPLHPYRWIEEQRGILRAELDALYAKLYGLTNPEFEYILTTFPVLEKNEVWGLGSIGRGGWCWRLGSGWILVKSKICPK